MFGGLIVTASGSTAVFHDHPSLSHAGPRAAGAGARATKTLPISPAAPVAFWTDTASVVEVHVSQSWRASSCADEHEPHDEAAGPACRRRHDAPRCAVRPGMRAPEFIPTLVN